MNTCQIIILAAFVTWNIVTFAMYGIDKAKARKRTWRTRESTLIIVAFLMGAIGALAGMSVLRHKTSRIKFKLLVPLALIFNIGIVIAYFMFIVS